MATRRIKDEKLIANYEASVLSETKWYNVMGIAKLTFAGWIGSTKADMCFD